MSSNQETTHVDDEEIAYYSTVAHATNEAEHSESEVRMIDNNAHGVPVVVQHSFVHPDNDIEIDFEREIEYYSTVAHATNEAEHSESETEHPQFSGEVYYQPEFTEEQWKHFYKLREEFNAHEDYILAIIREAAADYSNYSKGNYSKYSTDDEKSESSDDEADEAVDESCESSDEEVDGVDDVEEVEDVVDEPEHSESQVGPNVRNAHASDELVIIQEGGNGNSESSDDLVIIQEGQTFGSRVVTDNIEVGNQNMTHVCRSQDLTPLEERIEPNSLDEDFIEQDESQGGSAEWIPTSSVATSVETTPSTESLEATASSE